MQDFSLYFELGWQHILDWEGYDHILFVAALCGVYLLRDWRRVLILVTAFTIGHSVTLALSVYDKIKLPSSLIEFLIPVTIIFTAVSNILNRNNSNNYRKLNYLMALFFGLIHGMGFSNYLKSLLGRGTSIIEPLFAFNIGLEFGQIVIVLTVLTISYLAIRILKAPQRQWVLFLSSAIFGVALLMAIGRLQLLL